MTYGIKVAKDGSSVHSTNESDLSIDSSYGTRTVRLEGTIDVTTTGTSTWGTATLTHNFGYRPQMSAFAEFGPSDFYRELPFYLGYDAGPNACRTACLLAGSPDNPVTTESMTYKIEENTIVFSAQHYCHCVFNDTYTYYTTTFTIRYRLYMEEVELP